MNDPEKSSEIDDLRENIRRLHSICKSKDLFNKEKIKNCKGLKKILDKSAKIVEFLDDTYREMLEDLNFYYVDHCEGPEIKVNPKTYGKKNNFLKKS